MARCRPVDIRYSTVLDRQYHSPAGSSRAPPAPVTLSIIMLSAANLWRALNAVSLHCPRAHPSKGMPSNSFSATTRAERGCLLPSSEPSAAAASASRKMRCVGRPGSATTDRMPMLSASTHRRASAKARASEYMTSAARRMWNPSPTADRGVGLHMSNRAVRTRSLSPALSTATSVSFRAAGS